MPDLSNYTGEPLSEIAERFCSRLEEHGFRIATGNMSPQKDKRHVLRILWRGVYVGLMRADVWRKGFCCVYRFRPWVTGRGAAFKCPREFSVQEFCVQHKCLPDALWLKSEGSDFYLYVREQEAAVHLMRYSAVKIDEALFPSSGRHDPLQIQKDLIALLADASVTETERMSWVAARLCQGQFRGDLERMYQAGCAATGLAVGAALRASHIVAWKDASPKERRDPYNGLLLAANLDALFDRHIITFLPDGRIKISRMLSADDRRKLGPLTNLLTKPCDKRAAYLQRHNAVFDELEKKRLALIDE